MHSISKLFNAGIIIQSVQKFLLTTPKCIIIKATDLVKIVNISHIRLQLEGFRFL